MRCEHCSTGGAGIFSEKHDFCAALAASGKSNDEIAKIVRDAYAGSPRLDLHPLRLRHVVWGVFLGMWLFSLSAGIIYSMLHWLIALT